MEYTPEQIKAAAEYCANSANCGQCPIDGTWNCRLIFTPRLLALEAENVDLRAESASYRQVKKVLADEGFSDLATMISRYKQVMADANEVDIAKDEELADLRAQIAESEKREKAAIECINRPIDYICAVMHYDKYGSRYTFALPSQWSDLKFGSYEDYQEFQMQLVYLLGEAKKKWDNKAKPCGLTAQEGNK